VQGCCLVSLPEWGVRIDSSTSQVLWHELGAMLSIWVGL